MGRQKKNILQTRLFVKIIPEQYSSEYELSKQKHNIKMIQVFSIVLICVSLVMLLQSILSLFYNLFIFPDIRYLYLFVFLFVFSMVYIVILFPFKRNISRQHHRVKNLLISIFTLIFFVWGILLSLLDIIYTSQQSTYIMVVMCVAILIRVRVYVFMILVSIAAAVFIYMISYLSFSKFIFISYITTTAIFTAVTYVISILLTNNFANNFWSKKTIEGQNDKLEQLTNTDVLTGLYNRRFLFRELKKELKRAQRYGYNITLMFIDIDHFKSINDSMGHQTGDKVIKEIAGIIKDILRESDLVARYGGEEFVVASLNTPLQGGLVLAERVRFIVEEYSRKNLPVVITVSVGIAEVSDMTLEDAIHTVDKLLYKAKNNGRNRIEMAS